MPDRPPVQVLFSTATAGNVGREIAAAASAINLVASAVVAKDRQLTAERGREAAALAVEALMLWRSGLRVIRNGRDAGQIVYEDPRDDVRQHGISQAEELLNEFLSIPSVQEAVAARLTEQEAEHLARDYVCAGPDEPMDDILTELKTERAAQLATAPAQVALGIPFADGRFLEIRGYTSPLLDTNSTDPIIRTTVRAITPNSIALHAAPGS